MKAGPRLAGSSRTARAAGRAWATWAGCVSRSQKAVTARKASLTVVDGAPGCSTCWSTGSGMRELKVSPASSSRGSRLAEATAAAVTMLVAPGPTEEVATITWRAFTALA